MFIKHHRWPLFFFKQGMWVFLINLFILLYNTVLVLLYIDLTPPWVYMCSPSWTTLPPPSPSHPSLITILLFLYFPNIYAVSFSFYLYISQPFSYCSWGSWGKNTGVGCHFLLQWTIFCQNSSLWPSRFEWPWTICHIASLSYKSPFAAKRLCSNTGKD